jgi:N-acetylneuraminate synthase/sialic acid synthase
MPAVALGACVVERHFTLDRSQRGTDHQASLEPGHFAGLCAMIRETEAAMRLRKKQVCPTERASAAKLRKASSSPGTSPPAMSWDRPTSP